MAFEYFDIVDKVKSGGEAEYMRIISDLIVGFDQRAFSGKKTACCGCGGKDRFNLSKAYGSLDQTAWCTGGDGNTRKMDIISLVAHNRTGDDYMKAVDIIKEYYGVSEMSELSRAENALLVQASKAKQVKMVAERRAKLIASHLRVANELNKTFFYIPMPREGDTTKYLRSKREAPCQSVKIQGDDLLIPTMDENNKTWGYQRITKTSKRFQPNQKVNGLFLDIDGSDPKAPIVLAEGYATGLSVFRMLGGKKTVRVCFVSGNIKHVLINLICKHETISDADRSYMAANGKPPSHLAISRPYVVLMADNDNHKRIVNNKRFKKIGKPETAKNAGHETMNLCAKFGVMGFSPILTDGDGVSDWNDVSCREGYLGAVKMVAKQVETAKNHVKRHLKGLTPVP